MAKRLSLTFVAWTASGVVLVIAAQAEAAELIAHGSLGEHTRDESGNLSGVGSYIVTAGASRRGYLST